MAEVGRVAGMIALAVAVADVKVIVILMVTLIVLPPPQVRITFPVRIWPGTAEANTAGLKVTGIAEPKL